LTRNVAHLAKLEEQGDGLMYTLIIYTSDHGLTQDITAFGAKGNSTRRSICTNLLARSRLSGAGQVV
jgi:hypothetical protein